VDPSGSSSAGSTTWSICASDDPGRRRRKRSAKIVARDELARVCPLLFEHVIPSGTYHFDRILEREAIK